MQWVSICPCLTALPALSVPGGLVKDASGRGRNMADGTVREIFNDRTDRHDWDFGGTAVATHFRHGDVSNLDTSLGHKAILHNLNGKRARRIAWPRGERLDTGLSLSGSSPTLAVTPMRIA